MKVQEAKTAMAWPWMIRSHGDDYVDPGEILAKVKDEKLARQFAASGKMLAQLKSNEIALRKFSEMESVDANWRRLAEHEAGWNRILVAEIEGVE